MFVSTSFLSIVFPDFSTPEFLEDSFQLDFAGRHIHCLHDRFGIILDAENFFNLFNIPFIDIQSVSIPDSLLSFINSDLLRKFKAVPFEQVDKIVKIAMVDPFDIQAIQSLESKFPIGTKLSVYIAVETALQMVLDRKVGEAITGEVSKALEDVDEKAMDIEDDALSLESTDLQNAPVARIVNSIFQFGVKQSASDIHIEPMESKLRVRFRIHGILTEKLSLPKHLTSVVISRIKIMSKMDIAETRLPQDGRISRKIDGREIDFRV
jgi:type IV pilus assembly protein PilB